MMLNEDMAKLRGEVKRLSDNGLTNEEIVRRLETAGIPQDVIEQLVKLPKTTSIPAKPDKPDLLELLDSLAIFLDKAIPKLYDRGEQQLEVMADLNNWRITIKGALHDSR